MTNQREIISPDRFTAILNDSAVTRIVTVLDDLFDASNVLDVLALVCHY